MKKAHICTCAEKAKGKLSEVKRIQNVLYSVYSATDQTVRNKAINNRHETGKMDSAQLLAPPSQLMRLCFPSNVEDKNKSFGETPKLV